MLDPKCNNGFITFRTKFLLHLGPLLHLGTSITFEASTNRHIAAKCSALGKWDSPGMVYN